MPEGVRGAGAAQSEVEITRRRFMTESLLMKRERERELKRHQERVQNMKPCVDTKPSFVRSDAFPVRLNRPPVRSRVDKGTVTALLPSPMFLQIGVSILVLTAFSIDYVSVHSVLKLQVQRLKSVTVFMINAVVSIYRIVSI